MFVQSAALIEAKKGDISRINVYTQEKEPVTYPLANALRGISHNLGGEAENTFCRDIYKGIVFFMAIFIWKM